MSFKYSVDDYIASKQKEEADKLLDDITRYSNLQYSPKIDEAFDKVTYGYLEEFVKLVREEMKERIIIVAIPRKSDHFRAQMDLKTAYERLEKSWKDPIPYIEHSFSENYKCPHGPDFMHAFFFFFTKYHDFKGSEDCVSYYLNRINKLKVFL